MSRWLRRGAIDVEVVCDGEVHRLRCDGTSVTPLDHGADDPELILSTLGGAPIGACFAVLRAWDDGRLDEVPRSLRTLLVERWRRAGIAPAAVEAFVAACERPAPSLVHVTGMHPAIDAAVWWEALGERPRPQLLEPFANLRVDGSEAFAWREALGRAVRPTDVVSARAAGIASGHEARLWTDATGELPSSAMRRRWADAGVDDAFTAAMWAEVRGRQVTPDDVLALRSAGIDDPEAVVAERASGLT